MMYIYIVNYKDMRRINENDMSRIIKKVLREESTLGVGPDVEINACFDAVGIPMPYQCQPSGYVTDEYGDDMLAVMSPGCIAKITTMMATNPMIMTKIGTLLACIGSLPFIKRYKK